MFNGTTKRLPGGTTDPFGGSSKSVNGPDKQNKNQQAKKIDFFKLKCCCDIQNTNARRTGNKEFQKESFKLTEEQIQKIITMSVSSSTTDIYQFHILNSVKVKDGQTKS